MSDKDVQEKVWGGGYGRVQSLHSRNFLVSAVRKLCKPNAFFVMFQKLYYTDITDYTISH
jgi:hypothetical protein